MSRATTMGIVLVVLGSELVWSCREWFQPPTGIEMEYMELRVQLSMAVN